jgi:hypothetical protein
MADKLPSASFHFVLHEDGHRFSVSGEREASDIDYFPVLFGTLLDRILVNVLYRDHGIAEASLEGRLRSVQPRSVTLPGWIGAAEGVAFQLQGHGEFILGSVHTLRDLQWYGQRSASGGYSHLHAGPPDSLFFRAG